MCRCCILIYMFMQKYTYICWLHADAMNNRRRRISLTKYLPLTLLQGFEKGYSGFSRERELQTEHNWNILTPNVWPSALCLSRSPGLLNRRPRAHSARWWLSLLHLISVFSGPQLIRAQMAPLAWCGFPYHISSITPSISNWLQLHWLVELNWVI